MLFSTGSFSASYVTSKENFNFSFKKKRKKEKSWSYQPRTFSKKPGGSEVFTCQGQNTDAWPKMDFIIFILDFGKTSTQVPTKEHKYMCSLDYTGRKCNNWEGQNEQRCFLEAELSEMEKPSRQKTSVMKGFSPHKNVQIFQINQTI